MTEDRANDPFLRGLAFEIAQLRHAYAHLAAGRVNKQREFADGLISPAIQFLEGVYRDAADQNMPASSISPERE